MHLLVDLVGVQIGPQGRLELNLVAFACGYQLGDIDPDRRGGSGFSRPGKPTDNAYIEAFNGRFRTECLNQRWFLTLADAAEKLEAWRRYYNEEQPHGAIGNKVPIALTKSGGATSPSP